MPYSRIKQLWKGIKVLANLKFMDLSHFKYLIETLNFQGVTNLKRLVLEGCVSLHKYLLLFSFLINLKILSFKGCNGPSSTLWLLPRRSSNSIGSILQPLSGLCSLTTLNLSNCNLSDEPNLSSLGFLSSLEELYLVLPELPSSIYYICAENCTSLKDVSYQAFKSLLPTGQQQKRKFMRIDPVVKLGIAIVALKAFIPGSRIPDWIRYQSSGSEVKAELPPNWFNSNFLGFAFSFVTCGHFSCLFMLKADVLWESQQSPMIRFNSISSPPPPPHSKSTVVLEEIHEEEPSGNGCSNEPRTATVCSEDRSESDIRPQKCLKCRH
ncbi:hypothetical protein AAG906_023547 [Vitis piasezkii]